MVQERVIVSQLVRSPSVYFNEKIDKMDVKVDDATIIPNRGAWLGYMKQMLKTSFTFELIEHVNYL